MSAYYRGALPTTFETYVRRGLPFSNIGSDVGFLWEDFALNKDPPGFTLQAAAGGASSTLLAKGGVGRLDTSAGAGGTASHWCAGGMATAAATDKWYCACRFKVALAVTANTRVGVGIINNAQTKAVTVGAYGGLSTTQFVLQYDGFRTGTGVNLGAIDTSYHVAEIWHPGDGKYHCVFDGGSEITPVTPTTPPEQVMLWHDANNNGAASQFVIDRDWCVYLFQR